ncbi:MAG: cytochrome c [Pseudohongiellaceae bacterium]
MPLKKRVSIGFLVLGCLILALVWLFYPPSVPTNLSLSSSEEAIARGEYLVTAGGCVSCHRSEEGSETLAGGHGLETEFGVFYAPNITPDLETGIGHWQARDFIAALKHGRTPSGSFYFPAFPYRAYAGLTDQDAVDIGSYLMSLEPISSQVAEPETPVWLSRWAVAGWNLMASIAEPEREVFQDETLERGAYLARNLGHCGECHTPRNSLGIPNYSNEYGGAVFGDEVIEAIDAQALAEWTEDSFDLFLLLGLKQSGEFVGGDMNDVIEHNTSKLTDADRLAMAAFFTRHNPQ